MNESDHKKAQIVVFQILYNFYLKLVINMCWACRFKTYVLTDLILHPLSPSSSDLRSTDLILLDFCCGVVQRTKFK